MVKWKKDDLSTFLNSVQGIPGTHYNFPLVCGMTSWLANSVRCYLIPEKNRPVSRLYLEIAATLTWLNLLGQPLSIDPNFELLA